MIFYIYDCEEKLGYVFKDKELLRQCFTHSSYSHEHPGSKDNERLEFFGDSILGYVTAEYLMKKYPTADEGELTSYKQSLVSRKPLADAIVRAGLNEHIFFGEGEKKNVEMHDAAYENLFEAIVAGIYYDGGIEPCKKFIESKLFAYHKKNSPAKQPNKQQASLDAKPNNKSKTQGKLQSKALVNNQMPEKPIEYKNLLQEYIQKYKLGEIKYEEIGRSGPPHNPVFEMSVSLSGKVLGTGKGKNKSEASKAAAMVAYNAIAKRRNNR